MAVRRPCDSLLNKYFLPKQRTHHLSLGYYPNTKYYFYVAVELLILIAMENLRGIKCLEFVL